MKKFTNWSKQPITWGGYLKLCAICLVFGLAELAYVIWINTTYIEDAIASMKDFFSKIERKIWF